MFTVNKVPFLAPAETARVTIVDNHSNPYGRELAAILAERFKVEAILPAGTEWLPRGVDCCLLLPIGQSSLAMQILRQARGLARIAWNALARRATVIVTSTRGWYDELALALLASVGARIIVIAHDPVPKRPLPRLLAFSRRLLWRRAAVLVAHSARMAVEARAACGRVAEAILHLPFVEYAEWAREAAPDARTAGRCRLLILGHMREDKGLDRIPAILQLIPIKERRSFSLSFAGCGTCSNVVVSAARFVTVTREPSVELLSDMEIAQELAWSDVLLAPYPVVSASGSVVLGLSRGLRVVAYNSGALADVVEPSGLVALGDEGAFAERIIAAAHSECGKPARPIAEWRATCLEAWSKIILGGINISLPADFQSEAMASASGVQTCASNSSSTRQFQLNERH